MAKTKISEFSSTPGNNTDIDSINISEGCAPSGINDAIRELMAQLKDFQTGAAGDSFNGPVGTTTPAAGSFTTLSASGAVTLSGGTANGVAYLNGSKVLTTGSALTFDGTNLGVLSAGLNVGDGTTTLRSVAAGGVGLFGTSTDHPLAFRLNNTEQMRLTTTGLGIGTSSPTNKLSVTGNANITGNTTLGDASTDTVTVNGYVGQGTSPSGEYGYRMSYTGSTGTAQYGFFVDAFGSSAATASVTGLRVRARSSAAAYTMGSAWGLFVDGAGLGAGSTITNAVGLFIQDQTVGTNNYGVQSAVSSGTNKWNIYASGTAANYFAGNVGIGASSPATRLEVTPTTGEFDGIKVSRGPTFESTQYSIINQHTGALKLTSVVTGGGSAGAIVFLRSNNGTTATESMRIDSSGNLGLGVTPSGSWGSPALMLGKPSASNPTYPFITSPETQQIVVGSNSYWDGTNWKAAFAGSAVVAMQQRINYNQISWHAAAAVSQGSTQSFTQAMTLDASGALGVGNTSPSTFDRLVVSNALATTGTGIVSGNGLTLQNTNATAGNYTTIQNRDSGGNQNAQIQFINVTHGNPFQGAIAFTTRNSTSDFTERARIDSSGNLLIGTTSSAETTAGVKIRSYSASSANVMIGDALTTNDNVRYILYSTGASAYRFYVGMGGTIFATSTSISAISDVTLKENVRDLETGLTEVMALRPRRFDWKNGDAHDVAGFVAQEVEQVLPELVTDYLYNKDEQGNDIIKKSLKMGDILPTLVNAIQEQQAIIESLKARLDAANL